MVRNEGNIMELPEFDAFEINELISRARKDEYYSKCKRFVLEYLDMDYPERNLSEKQIKWLWGIKADLKEN